MGKISDITFDDFLKNCILSHMTINNCMGVVLINENPLYVKKFVIITLWSPNCGWKCAAVEGTRWRERTMYIAIYGFNVECMFSVYIFFSRMSNI